MNQESDGETVLEMDIDNSLDGNEDNTVTNDVVQIDSLLANPLVRTENIQILTDNNEVSNEIQVEETEIVHPNNEISGGQNEPALHLSQSKRQTLEICSRCKKTLGNADNDDDSPRKKIKVMENDEGISCSICLEDWTNVGDHRVCSLKCGHLFGFSCVKRWITESSRSCPTCKKKCTLREIRHIYATKLIAMDAIEFSKLQTSFDKVSKEKNILEQKLAQSTLKNQKMTEEVEKMKLEISLLQKALETQKHVRLSEINPNDNNSGKIRAHIEKVLEVNKDGGCRVLDCQSNIDLLITSTKSNNPLFNGYGVKKIAISNYKTTAFIPLHSMTIRDISFQPQTRNFITVSLDKTFKLTDSNNNFVIFSKTALSALWSCCWDLENPFMFYVGEQQGSCLQYDIRNVSQSLNTYSQSGDMSPVVSLASIPPCRVPLSQGGLMCCKLNGLYVYTNRGEELESHWIPYTGPFVSMRLDVETDQFLVSTRSSSSNPYSRHSILHLDKDPDTEKITGNAVFCFKGGSMQRMLSRSAIISGEDDKYVAAYEESYKSLLLWSISTGQQVGSIPAHEPILDLCGFTINKQPFLATLSEKKLMFFKYS
ncbi:E3 ubiquitin-protein ligase RFWD3-like [Agrilus planipennis]|uniref:RING-type E3 ubiquitin transferase n=1 Tax=Agrilus planipennis TaxID=224129 RepID=A0A1W4XAH0_AGRPL|nr:E3 ubiquitin-protein ligase RFWD3-like [Agrilus planipennis]XP_018333030.1 E3 ubiquitin-protein ligase RFWD3-like [Agrilus planipennis]